MLVGTDGPGVAGNCTTCTGVAYVGVTCCCAIGVCATLCCITGVWTVLVCKTLGGVTAGCAGAFDACAAKLDVMVALVLCCSCRAAFVFL